MIKFFVSNIFTEAKFFIMLTFFVLLMLIFTTPVFAQTNKSPEWVSSLKAAQNSTQLVIVSGMRGSNARFSFHEKDSDSSEWCEIISCPAYIGKKGWGKTHEGDQKTPQGIYKFTMAFGINDDPGCPMGYTKVDESHYWCGDVNSEHYNKFISTDNFNDFDMDNSEHIIDYDVAYKYCLNINYNEECKPGAGSAIFLHCQTKNKFTAGCVAIPESVMIEVLKRVKNDCVIIMDTSKNIKSY